MDEDEDELRALVIWLDERFGRRRYFHLKRREKLTHFELVARELLARQQRIEGERPGATAGVERMVSPVAE